MEVNNSTMESATSKMDELRKRDDFEQSKLGMLEKMSAEPNISPATRTEENTPEVINTEVRDSKIGLIKLFIQLAKDGSMDYEEVVERIDQVRENKFISEDDAKDLKKELDVAFGKTPEQIHEAKVGLIRLFIEMAKENQMEYEEVLERIQQVKDNNFISAEDQTQLIHELDEALGRTPEQLRASKLKLLESFISMYQKGQMDKDEVEEYIGVVVGNNYISEDDAKNLRSQLESRKTAEENKPTLELVFDGKSFQIPADYNQDTSVFLLPDGRILTYDSIRGDVPLAEDLQVAEKVSDVVYPGTDESLLGLSVDELKQKLASVGRTLVEAK